MNIKAKAITYFLLTITMLIISGLSILYIYRSFGDKDLIPTLGFLTGPMLFWIVALLIVYFLSDALRFFFILKTLKINVSFWYMLKLAFVNIFISNITPLATGGGFVQIYFLNKKNIPVGDATAASTIRTMLPILFFFVTTPFLLLKNEMLLKLIPNRQPTLYLFLLVMIYGLIAYACFRLIKNARIMKAWVFKACRFLRRKKMLSHRRARKTSLTLFREIESFTRGFKMFVMGDKRYLILSFTFTFIFLFSLFSFPILLLKAQGYQVSPLFVIETQIILTFITYFAPTPGATGVAEGGFALIFQNVVNKGDVAPLTLAWRFFTIYIGLLIGMACFYIEAFKPSKSKKE